MARDESVKVPVEDLSTTFMRCARCFDAEPVAGLSPLWPPRGWAGPAVLRRPVLLVLSMNPGHPIQLADKHGPGWNEAAVLQRHGMLGAQGDRSEIVMRRRLSVTTEAAGDVAALCWRSYDTPTMASDHLFHRRSVAYARACLWLMNSDPDRWRSHCWFSDVVKCSTTKETKVGVPTEAVTRCKPHLVREIDTLGPDVIVALGGDAKNAVDAAVADARLKPRIAQFLHPARWRKLTSDRQMVSFRASGLGSGRRSPGSPQFRDYLRQLQAEFERAPRAG